MTGNHVCIYKEVIINDHSKVSSTILCEDLYNSVYGCNTHVVTIIKNMYFKEELPGSEYMKIFIIICMPIFI